MRICVCYAGDSNVVKSAGISMISLFETNREVKEIVVYFVEDSITETDKSNLTQICRKYERELKIIKIEELIENINIYDSKYPRSSFVRLFVEKLPEERILYLDCDTLVCSCLKDLFQTNLEEKWMGAVQDIVPEKYRYKIGLDRLDKYINAGVLLMNLDALRDNQFSKRALQFIEQYVSENGTMVAHNDQGVINVVAHENIFFLSPEYNMTSVILLYRVKDLKKIFSMDSFYAEENVNNAKKNPAILHFVPGTYGRPWQEYCKHPYRNLYRNYMDISPWKGLYEKSNLPIRRKLDRYLYKILPVSIYIKIKNGYRDVKTGNN